MSILNFLRFLRDMGGALYWEAAYRYWSIAYRHCGESHPDAWLISRRMMMARLASNDLVRKHLK